MKLKVISPEQVLLECEVSAVELPGAKGRFMVLKNHAPILTQLVDGRLRYDRIGGNGREELPISGGFAKVINDEISVCVE